MANFWDLPRPLRERIYRLHLVQDDPIDLAQFQAACGRLVWSIHNRTARRGMPQVMQLAKTVERDTANIYFRENTFVLHKPNEAWSWKTRIWPRHLKLIRKMIIEWPEAHEYGQGYNEGFRDLQSFKGLQTLVLKVDEQTALEKRLSRHSSIKWHRSLGCSPQLQLQSLYFDGIQGLRTLTGIPCIQFPPLTNDGRERHGGSGAIEGGVLDTWMRHDMMRSPRTQQYQRQGYFKFLDLPPEVRNMVYEVLLVFPGVTYPTAGKPSSVASQFPYLRNIDKDDVPVPHSALAILQANREIHNEAAGIFYRQNDLVFSYPAHLQDFAQNLEPARLESISSLTLFHKDHSEGGISTMATTLKLVRRMRGLKKFHLLLEHHLITGRWWSTRLHERCVTKIKGIQVLFTLRGIIDIKVRDLDLEERAHKAGDPANHTHSDAKEVINGEVEVLKHFNYGLALAQKGEISVLMSITLKLEVGAIITKRERHPNTKCMYLVDSCFRTHTANVSCNNPPQSFP